MQVAHPSLRQAECGALEGPLSYSALKSLPYAEHFIFEVLRLYPPVPSDPKEVMEDDVLPGGVQVYKGETGERECVAGRLFF